MFAHPHALRQSSQNSKNPISTPTIILIAVLAVAAIVIAGVFVVVLTLNPVSTTQTGSANQTNVSNIAFRLPEGKVQTVGFGPCTLRLAYLIPVFGFTACKG